MMSTAGFLFAVAALLIVPGPTNTLVGLAGAQGGWRRAVRLIPAELAGYASAIAPLGHMGSRVLQQWPHAAQAFSLLAAAWVLRLSFGLWQPVSPCSSGQAVTARDVYLTTLLNPKAIVVAVVLLPPPGHPAYSGRLALYGLAVVVIAGLWGTAGHLSRTGGSSDRRALLLRRLASAWLAVISGTLVMTVLGR